MSTVVDTIINEKAVELEGALVGLEKSMTYSLADAIREGSTVTSQCIDNWADSETGSVCALSAALIAAKARHLI